MKNKEKQEFRSSGILTLLGLVGLCAILIATPWNRQINNDQIEIARLKAEVVGYQVVQIYKESLKVSQQSNKNTNLRRPASSVVSEKNAASLRNIGTMGMDPWGEPFHYRLLSSDEAKITKVLVWSSGPNKKIESINLANENLTLTDQPSYFGDDLGIVLSMSQR
ncbi:MAG: hypothetical protein ACXVCP_06365 [Bdellovibrio sp.]